MKTAIKRPLAIFLALVLAAFGCMCIAHGIQTDHGNVKVSAGVIETDVGDLTYKLYTPKSATAEHPAPGVLLLHGYQNDSETCAAYSIELARRGVVVMSLDDETGNLMTLELVAPDQRQAVRLSRLFEKKAEAIYSLTMAELLDDEDTLDD